MEPVTDEEIGESLRGATAWITPALMRNTLDTWQPYYVERLSADEALDILIRVGQLYRLLNEPPKDASTVSGEGVPSPQKPRQQRR